jgi:AraC-like DNA-binding protein
VKRRGVLEDYEITLDRKGTFWTFGIPSARTQKLPFYLWEWGHFTTLRGYYTTRENYPQFLLFHTLDGEGRLYYDYREYVLSRNTVAVIHCEKSHRYENISDRWEFNWFHFSGTIARDYCELFNDGDGLTIQELHPGDPEAEMIVEIIAQDNRIDFIKDLNTSAKITSLMTMLVTRKLRARQHDYHAVKSNINNAISFMLNNLTADISIDRIADTVNLSKYHFCRMFKNQTGITPYEYLINLRIHRAKQLLRTGSITLDAVASQSGFLNSKNLIYNFRRLTGLTPGAYRRSVDAIV